MDLATWDHHFDPTTDGMFNAQAFEADATGVASPAFQAGDQLVFKYTGASAKLADAYIPDGDGARLNGRIPNLTLPH